MRKRILTAVFIVFSFLLFTPIQADEASAKEGKWWTPIRFTLWPRLIGIPWNTNVYGLNIGLATDIDKDCELVGVDIGPLASTTNNATGLLMSLGSNTNNSNAVQLCMTGGMHNSSGVQIGCVLLYARKCKSIIQLFGMANEVHGTDDAFQLGMYNRSTDSRGFQIGLMNYMDDGFLPLFPFFNFSLSESHKDKQAPGEL